MATSFNVEQTMATLETTTNLQFSQKTYSVLVKGNYKHRSILFTHALDMRTIVKSFTISQAQYIPDIFETKATLSKFSERSVL